MSYPSNFPKDKLKALVLRVENLDNEIAERNEDKKDIYREAKSLGIDVKVLKTVLARRRRDPGKVQEVDDLVEYYEDVLNGK
jgi:uncharacterized protein (UPF0335 family)